MPSRSRTLRPGSRCSPRRSWRRTTDSATSGARSPRQRARDRSWRSRSRLRGASRRASGSSSSPRSRRSPTTRSSWRTISREPPAARSSAAELFEAERAIRAIAQQLARTGTLLASELDPDAILEEIVAQAPGLVGADAAAVSLPRGRRARRQRRARGGRRGGDRQPRLGGRRARRRGRPVARPCSRRRRRSGDSSAARTRSSRPATRAYLGAPLVGAEEESTACWPCTRGSRALARGGGRGPCGAGRKRLRVPLERRAVPAGRARARAQLAILGNVADGIVAVDREGNVVLWNAAAEEITGVPASEAIGRRPADVLQRSLEAGRDLRRGPGLIQIRARRGRVWLSVSEAVMRDPAGAVAGRIYAFRDVSSDRLVEQLKSGFVSTVSHELRAPLTSIYGFAETLLREDVAFGDEERRMFLELHRLGGAAPDRHRRRAAERGAARVRRPPGAVRAHRSPRGRLGRRRERGAGARERAPFRHRRSRRSRSTRPPTATRSGRSSRTSSTTQSSSPRAAAR